MSDNTSYKRFAIAFLWSVVVWFGICPGAIAQSLNDRWVQFPDWQSKPSVQAAKGDLVYPEWMAGTWEVTSTLVEAIAPLAPTVMTPGFESNRQSIDRPILFQVRFIPQPLPPISPGIFPISTRSVQTAPIVADRAFNGLNIARAYLGEAGVRSVKVDPDNPNREITTLADRRQLVSVVTGRSQETPNPDRFLATEFLNQVFRSTEQIYLNQVEISTAYRLISPDAIAAEQISAIYLSPQDPQYFTARDRPVALYRYQLALDRQKTDRNSSLTP